MIGLQALTFTVATSYLTLGIFSTSRAVDLWWQYALIMFVLTAACLVLSRPGRHR